MRSYFDYHALTIGAGESETLDITGQFLNVNESQAKLICQLDSGSKFPIEVGLDFSLEPEIRDGNGLVIREADQFKRVTFFNETAVDNAISFYVGRGHISDYRLNALVTRDITVHQRPDSTLGVGTAVLTGVTTVFPGTLVGVSRREISVYNPGSDFNVEVLDATGAIFAYVWPGSSWTHESDDRFSVHNTESVTVIVGELFYTS